MDYNFKHYLVINSEEIEILEPINFDASSFVVEQDKKKWGRDIYKGNEDISLYFGNEIGEPLEVERVLNNGMILRHKNSGLDLLLNINNEFGSEAVIYWKLEYGSEFLLFELDFGTAKTDNLTYIELSVTQNLEQAKIKRREGIKIDAFSEVDLDSNTITPIQTQKLFMKAKPIFQQSEWTTPSTFNDIASGGLGGVVSVNYNLINQVESYGIEDTLSYISGEGSLSDFAYIESANELSSLKIEMNIDILLSLNSSLGHAFYNMYYYVGATPPSSIISAGVVSVFGGNLNFSNSDLSAEIQNTFIFENINVPIGYRLYIWLSASIVTNNNPIFLTTSFRESKITISTTSTAISSVITAVRYIDLIKQNYKGIGANNVVAPKFDVGGQFYNNFCFNGKLIRQITDEPFYLELKDTLGSLEEFCADSQVNETTNYIGQYTDFYPNIDLGGFLINPDKEFNIEKNERYLINKFTFDYDKYQKDNDEENTLDAIHTESEWYVPNNKSQNEKKVSLPFARDHFLAEYLRKKATNNTSADIDDDTIFIFDITSLPPNSRDSFTAVLKFQKNGTDGTFKILATENFSWDLLGFNNGDNIIVNGVTYLVTDLESTVITLQYTGSTSQGEDVFTIDYPLTNVNYTIRTNEGLIYSENLLNPDAYGNLRYSIKHNFKYWREYLATAGKFITAKEITNSYFKANGECITQYTDDTEQIKENASIPISEITDYKILTQNIINTTITADFSKVKKLIEDLQTVNADNSVGGFIRCQDANGRVFKGYIQKLESLWKYEELELVLEERNESDFLDIVFDGGIFTINEVGYDTKTFTEKRYNIFNEFIQFFDINNVFLCNRTKYNQVRLNGVVYDSVDELVIAIDLLS